MEVNARVYFPSCGSVDWLYFTMSTEKPVSSAPAEPLSTDPIDRVIRYHVQTKHHFNRYARALGYLDWANQPDPFRRFEGAPLVSLPLLPPDEDPVSPAYDAIYQPGAVACQPVNVRTLSRFFEFALALSAWKKAGESEWALRSNPSSGNLHPTEGYLVAPQIDGLDLKPGLYHYAPKEHGLELRAEFSCRASCSAAGSVSSRGVSLRSDFRSLAGSLEVWRTSVSLLQPRCRSCDRLGADCCGDAGLEDGAARWPHRKIPPRCCWAPIARKTFKASNRNIRTVWLWSGPLGDVRGEGLGVKRGEQK